MSLVQRKPATQVLSNDGDPEPVDMLFAVESYLDESVGWVLECRSDERGYGTPLLWYSQEAAESWIKEGCEATGCYGGARVVGFSLTMRDKPTLRCDCCGKWGHDEADCANDDHDHTCVNVPAGES